MKAANAFRRWSGLWLLCLCGALHAQDPLNLQDEPPAQPAGAMLAEPRPVARDGNGNGNGNGGGGGGEEVANLPADEPTLATQSPPDAEAAPFDSGVASWYGDRFHGRPTASGEPFDMHALTAAHPTLPFGSIVRVRSLVNDRVVDVRINDRGPYSGGRIIDLSRAAAAVLGLIQSGAGIKPVQLRLLEGRSVERSQRPRRLFNARRSSPPRVR